VIGAVFYWRNGVELVARVQSQFRDRWSLHDQWGDTRITFSGPELASLRDALNRLDLPGVESRSGRWAPKLSG
jgi:hypothetical protein